MRFGAPGFLPLLLVPGVLTLVWVWQLWRRRADVRAIHARRHVPVRERVPFFGELLFWLCLIGASAAMILALARPQAVTSLVRTAGVDLVILQDGSASMQVDDMQSYTRWRRSMQFLRALGESLRWDDDRVAMALFAHMATPQIRLTKDPNTFFFFLDHLEERSPFRLEDDSSWDTNIERGVYWGLRLIEKDEEIRKATANVPGRVTERNNSRAFVLMTDGQAWSGEVAQSLAIAQEKGIPLNVVGVGTTAGGIIPDPKRDPMQAALRSSLNRAELMRIATAGGGRYYELDADTDRAVASEIIENTRRRAGTKGLQEGTQELYWTMLATAAFLFGLGILFLRDRTALALQIAAATAVLVLVTALL